MKKYFIKILCFILFLLFAFVPNLYAKNLKFQADANLNTIRWTTFVKAYSTSSSSNHTEPIILRDRKGGDGWYQTRYITFHLEDGAYYNASEKTKNDKLIFFDDSHGNVITGSNYRNYDGLVGYGSTYLEYNDPTDKSKEIYSTWQEDEYSTNRNQYAVEESSHYGEDSNGNTDKWMRISTFRLSEVETNRVQNLIEEKYKSGELETEEIEGILYAKVRLTNVLSTSTNGNMYNSYQFYFKSDNWIEQNAGMDSNGIYVKGQSALNNYDNELLIPFSEVPKNREIYITCRVDGSTGDEGVLWDGKEKFNNMQVDNTYTNSKENIDNEGDIKYNNEWWLAHYTLTPDQRNLRIKSVEISNYIFSGVKVISGEYNSGKIYNDDVVENGVEVANESSKEPIYVTLYYKKDPDTGGGGSSKNQYVYIKHVDQNTGTVINDLKGTETFSEGFRETDLTSLNAVRDYQTAYEFNADGIANGGIYIANDFNNSRKAVINGVEYEYVGVKKALASTYITANNDINTSKLLIDTGIWLNVKKTTTYNTIIFYYKKNDITEDDIELTGRLAFWTKYNNNYRNVEYIPSSTDEISNYLMPYIEGAKRYVLPYVNESGNSTDDTKSYMNDYTEYRYIKISGKSKKGTESTKYHNEYETTGKTRTEKEQPILANSSYTLNKENFTFISSTNTNVTSKELKFSNISLNANGSVSFEISGMENGKVKCWMEYSYYDKEYHKAVLPGPDGTGGSAAYTEYYYKKIIKCQKYNDDGTIGEEIISNSGTTKNETGITPSNQELNDVIRPVPVTYKVTLKQKFRLSHLWVYLIENTNVEIQETGTQPRGKVYQNNDSFTINTTGSRTSEEINNTYIGEVKKQLKKYYTEYLDTKEKLPLALKTESIDFEGECEKYKILKNAYNGLRFATANIKYKMYDLATNSYGIDEKTKNYDVNSYNITKESFVKSYEVNENINIYTPISINKAKVENEAGSYVNHSAREQDGVIQKNAKFKFTPQAQNISYGTNGTFSDEYISKYLVKFDFEISNFKIFNSHGTEKDNKYGSTLSANTLVTLEKGDYIEGIASNGTSSDLVGQFANKYKIFAIATNVISDNFVTNQLNNDFSLNYDKISTSPYVYIDSISNTRVENPNIGNSSSKDPSSKNGNNESQMTEDAHYIVERIDNTANLNRIYDFKITDCTDLSYKDVFRKISDNSSVNERTTTSYYSGTRYWNLNTINVNQMLDRSFDGNVKTIIPLGPYKNTDTTYIFAPKLGYRFSFDLKTTGAITTTANSITNNKKVVITPSYYYIKNDGTNFNESIDLYYKNTSGKYVKFKDSGYKIQFRPNDGYRFTSNLYTTDNLEYMSDKLNNLNISSSSGFELNTKMIAISNSGFIQSWYGEFKLPNSTIAVPTGSSPNKENILTNGYIGVKFNIVAKDTINGTTSSISYNENDKAAVSSDNTTQWDYEGFLGFNQVGQKLTNQIKIQLENGIWKIDSDDLYQKIKGTVLLYDIDERAANDYT